MNMISIIIRTFFIYMVVSLVNTCSHHHVIDYIRAVFTLIFSMFFMYFGHFFQHKYNDSMFGKIHTAYHHNPKCKHKWYAKLIEHLNNSQLLLFILVNNLIKQITNVEIFSNYILVFVTLIYLWTHAIEYQNHPSITHMYHHKFDNEENRNNSSEIKNYSPLLVDMIFNTYHDCNQNDDLLVKVRHMMEIYLTYWATSIFFKIKK